ncbi:SDR family oxidoreductase [Caballeronia sp. SEWSISQ10-4 2]|uniref:SDR family NAD(P)-dependent oxidoreductase n=1 Tax=Caballeronia sp. SEWSISQ10-4 2 TaxID=2937438 RepID=UPI00264D83E3|nr:SDR family oxidoreductase [Caballeronia sp. SEWSISQ10-4 2]MDN7177354.1 SDR family oxidoreductase [Caballeronia sp. SEWSISQ10-4 2]
MQTLNQQTAPQSVLVTGANSGMGRATALRFVAEGWHVVAVDVTEPTHAADPNITSVVADITDEAALSAGVERALMNRPRLAAVVNAAGIFPTSSLTSYDVALYRRIFDINVLGTLNVARVGAKHIGPEEGGAMVFFASVDAFAVSRNQLLYSASKAAVVSLTRSLAIELAESRITVNAVAPGWVDTEGTRRGGRIEAAIPGIPLKRAASVDEIATWVWNLAGKPSYITGETVCIAGGIFMR